MGLRDKASQYRWGNVHFDLENLEEQISDKSLSRGEVIALKQVLHSKINNVRELLDRKLIDMQTLLEISREINSTLNFQDLLQIIIFTFMGHFQISDVAVLKIQDEAANVIGKRGFDTLLKLDLSLNIINFLNEEENQHQFIDLSQFDLVKSQLSSLDFSSIIPLAGKDGVFGFILLGQKFDKSDLTASERDFCLTLSSLAGVALENASLYEKLDKKYNELSALYEISQVINSTSDHALVLSLIMETLNTGFGVNKSLLILNKQDRLELVEHDGFSDSLKGMTIVQDEVLTKLIDSKEGNFILLSEELSQQLGLRQICLAVPLLSVDTLVGILLIFNSELYKISSQNEEIKNLFSIIASQMAPPILLTDILSQQQKKIEDPFHPLITSIVDETTKAQNYDTDITFCMITFKNIKEYFKHYGSKDSLNKLESIFSEIATILPSSAGLSRYGLNKFFLSLPAISENDYADLNQKILSVCTQAVTAKEIEISPDILKVTFPGDCEDPYAIISMLE